MADGAAELIVEREIRKHIVVRKVLLLKARVHVCGKGNVLHKRGVENIGRSELNDADSLLCHDKTDTITDRRPVILL